MENNILKQLIQNYLNGKVDEIQMFDFIKDYSLEELKNYFIDAMEVDFFLSKQYLRVDSQKAFENFLANIKHQEKKKESSKKILSQIIFKYAALFIGFIGLALILILVLKSYHTEPSLQISDDAVNLYLPNGIVEKLKKSERSNILYSDGQVIAVQTHEKLVYKPIEKPESTEYNELKVPYGKKFELEFSDGTVVYVNSGSSIKYPINFVKDKSREVFLKGEAFFKVSKDEDRPFIVNAGAIKVRVLGTEFNVSAYSEDNDISTVLVSGSVYLYDSINHNSHKEQVKLLPGKRGRWNKENGNFNIDEVDTSLYTAWVKNKLMFRGTPFSEIRKKLERHYGVSIINSNDVLDKNTFNACFSDESIEEILEILDRTYGIEYKLEENQIIIR